jgi:hypothetical protein
MSDKVITLVKYKTYFMPRSGEDYALMRKLKMPVTRIHHSALGILKHQADKNGIRLKGVSWNSILGEATTKIAQYWDGEFFKSEFTKNRMVCSTTHSSVLELGRTKASAVQGAIERFLQRWGFKGEFNYSESRDKLQLVVDYTFNKFRTPAVEVGQNPDDAPSYTFTVGFTRFKFTQTEKYLIWTLLMQSGTEWKEVRSGRSLLTDVSDPSDLIGGLLILPPVMKNHE